MSDLKPILLKARATQRRRTARVTFGEVSYIEETPRPHFTSNRRKLYRTRRPYHSNIQVIQTRLVEIRTNAVIFRTLKPIPLTSNTNDTIGIFSLSNFFRCLFYCLFYLWWLFCFHIWFTYEPIDDEQPPFYMFLFSLF